MSSPFDDNEITKLVLDGNTSGETLHEISKQGGHWAISRVIEHQNVLQKTIDDLLKTKDPIILRYILKSKHATEEILIEATTSDDPLVVEAAIDNEKMPKEGFNNIINGFSKDQAGRVYRTACVKLASDNRVAGLSLSLAKLKNESVTEGLINNPNTSAEALEYLYGLNNLFINTYIAGHPNTPVHILKNLLAKPSDNCIYYVLKNPSLPADIIRDVANSPNLTFENAMSIAKHNNTPVDVIDEFSKQEFSKPEPPQRVNGFLEGDIKKIVKCVASSRSLSDLAAKNIMEYEWPEVAMLIATNEYADIKTLAQLIISGSSKSIKKAAEDTFQKAMPRFEGMVTSGTLNLSDQVATYRRKPLQLGEFLERKGGEFITYYERFLSKQLERSVLQKASATNSADDISKPSSHRRMI
ncbi:hypothetical protein ACK32R_20965 [Aeromonas dhakensis]|jgi:hypothetical protein|uniref:hypothetical protein n=1 Tax=Aeromonas dhakensis TaxID=196024 RepID=UPI0039871645